MQQLKLGEMEQRFADLIWEREPVKSGELVKLCEEEFEWKKSTMFTMLKRLCERELFQNEGGMVTSCMTKEEFQAAQSEQFINETYGGSLPLFLTAFTKRKKLSKKEIEEIEKLIGEYKGE